ncbi:MAG: hypothetical protein IPJ88_14720 [Myxococcales bacterium]|nr:MAG: hypothetical protein IPJ88_14720 [Myxococcales bacterium]
MKKIRMGSLLAVCWLVGCGGSNARVDEKPVDRDLEPVPIGAVHPARTGVRSYPESEYEPTIIPPRGAVNDKGEKEVD